MKKIIFINSVIFLGVLPLLVSAITPGTIPTPEQLKVPEAPIKTHQGLLDRAGDVVTWVYRIFFIIAVLFVLFAAFNYLTAGGQPEKIKSAHSQLLYAAIAIAIALLAVGAVSIIKSFLGGETGAGGGGAAEQGAAGQQNIYQYEPGPYYQEENIYQYEPGPYYQED